MASTIGFPFLLSLLSRLKESRIEHYLVHEDDSIRVLANTELQKWEIKVDRDGRVAVTIFQRDPQVHGLDKLEELFAANPPN